MTAHSNANSTPSELPTILGVGSRPRMPTPPPTWIPIDEEQAFFEGPVIKSDAWWIAPNFEAATGKYSITTWTLNSDNLSVTEAIQYASDLLATINEITSCQASANSQVTDK